MGDYDDISLADYRDALASGNPTPGGGTAAAVALSQGAALTVMVCNLTIGKERWQEGWAHSENCLKIATLLMALGHELAAADSDAFDLVMAGFRLPKESDEEKAARKKAILDGTRVAADVPLKTAKEALTLLELLPKLAEVGNANAVTDVAVASLLVSAACKGALFNVQINATSLPGEEGDGLMAEVSEIRDSAKIVSRQVMIAVHNRLAD
jgi:formiminotetrahydrofolate cyclodeaminase